MHGFIFDSIASGGYLAILFLMILENVIPPIPSEAIMGLGGMLVAKGRLEFWPLLIVGTIGATLGNLPWFWLAQRWGYRRLRPLVDRWGRWLTLEWEDIEGASRFLRRHGQWVVLACRCSPFFRTWISVPAGMAQMKLWRFLVFTFIGAAAWNVLLIGGGHLLADAFGASQKVMAWMLVGTAVVGIVGYLWRLATWKPRNAPAA